MAYSQHTQRYRLRQFAKEYERMVFKMLQLLVSATGAAFSLLKFIYFRVKINIVVFIWCAY
jgi:hypothetical protein